MGISKLLHLDGWKNILGGLRMIGRETAGAIPGFSRLTPEAIAALYHGGGVTKNAVDIIAESMLQAGFEVQGDDGSLYAAFKALDGSTKLQQAMKETRKFGGAIVVMDVAGAGNWDTPWDAKKGFIRSLRVYPCTRVVLADMELVAIPESPYFEDYEHFVIRKTGGDTFRVHASRVLVFKSVTQVDPTMAGWLDYEVYWGLSAIYDGSEEGGNYGRTSRGISKLMDECSVGKYKLSNLEQLVAESDYKSIDNRMEAMEMQKSCLNAVFLGEGEEYTRENVSFAGVPEIWDRQMMSVAGAYRIPVTRFFGRSAAGMNATGEGDDDNYSAYIAGLQEVQLLPPLKKLMTALNASLNAVEVKDERTGLVIDFNPITKRNQEKDANVRLTMSQADRNYVESGILPPDEILRNRFQGGYSIDTSVDNDYVPNLAGEEGEGA